jgi:hypothetical protein
MAAERRTYGRVLISLLIRFSSDFVQECGVEGRAVLGYVGLSLPRKEDLVQAAELLEDSAGTGVFRHCEGLEPDRGRLLWNAGTSVSNGRSSQVDAPVVVVVLVASIERHEYHRSVP